MTAPSPGSPSRPVAAWVWPARRGTAAVLTGLIVVLAVLAGRYLGVGSDVIELHGYLGSAVFVLAIVHLGLVLASRPSGLEFGLAVALVVGVFAQIGLGYVGRESVEATAWHIPNGVLLMGLAGYQLSARPRTT